jgi:ubiquinone/menaquinone biosynthesis C-methylase UbiE
MDEARDRAHFNRRSSTYEQAWIQRYLDRIHAAIVDQIASSEPVSHVLDVGCGTGRLLRRLAVKWPTARLSGVDPSEGMTEVARRLTPHATFHISPAARLPFGAETVDVVVSSVSLHHWPDPATGLQEVARVLRPGGRLALADVAVPRWLAWLPRSGPRTKAELLHLVAGAGLAVVAQQQLLTGLVVVITADKVRAAA